MDQIMLRIMLDQKGFYYARKHNYANSGNIDGNASFFYMEVRKAVIV